MTSRSTAFDKDFEESVEPSVLSSDPNERKLARRLRIQKRIEALQKLDEDIEENLVEESLTEKQIVASAKVLEKLIAEGNEVITNVRVANDGREIERRRGASLIREKLLAHLEESAEDCKRRYDIINERWSTILESNDPLDINSEMASQKEKCDQVLEKKDAVILELKREIEEADKKYFDDQKKQKDDIKLLIERIENQMKTMENVYSRELEMIEKTLKTERDTMVSNFEKKWEALYKQQEEEDIECDKRRNKIIKEYEEEMEKVMTDHDEEYRMQKIELESECQDLQQQVERTKALCLLNAEKLSYNYTVLKSREEENSIVKSQQKRKINKLQGLSNGLKKNYADLEENTKFEIQKLSNQIIKAHATISELEEKIVHFTNTNEKQYLSIWEMNTESANELLEKILEADKNIHERTLGIIWEPPAKRILKKEDLPSYRTALDLINKKKQEDALTSKVFKQEQVEQFSFESKYERQMLNKILKQISNSATYLIEDRLQDLISGKDEDEKTIIKLDNIFQALSISTSQEINMLLEFFLPYAYCRICSLEEFASSISSSKTSTKSVLLESCSKICDGCNDENVRKLVECVKNEVEVESDNSKELCVSEDSIISADFSKSSNGKLTDSRRNLILNNNDEMYKVLANGCAVDESMSKRFMCNNGHVLEIQAAHVTKAIKEIVKKCNSTELTKVLPFEERLKEKNYTISRNLSEKDIKKYWSQYRDIFDPQKEKLWDAIFMGLNKYYDILKERHNICSEIESLTKQNTELQRLLESHIACPDDGLSLLQVKSSNTQKRNK